MCHPQWADLDEGKLPPKHMHRPQFGFKLNIEEHLHGRSPIKQPHIRALRCPRVFTRARVSARREKMSFSEVSSTVGVFSSGRSLCFLFVSVGATLGNSGVCVRARSQTGGAVEGRQMVYLRTIQM